jgi:hypothetical protein
MITFFNAHPEKAHFLIFALAGNIPFSLPSKVKSPSLSQPEKADSPIIVF